MSDEHTPVTPLFDLLAKELAELKARVNEIRSIQVENCGRDGRNGKFLTVRNDMLELEKKLNTNQQAIQQLMQQQEKLTTKLGLLVSTASGVAAAGATVLAKLFGG